MNSMSFETPIDAIIACCSSNLVRNFIYDLRTPQIDTNYVIKKYKKIFTSAKMLDPEICWRIDGKIIKTGVLGIIDIYVLMLAYGGSWFNGEYCTRNLIIQTACFNYSEPSTITLGIEQGEASYGTAMMNIAVFKYGNADPKVPSNLSASTLVMSVGGLDTEVIVFKLVVSKEEILRYLNVYLNFTNRHKYNSELYDKNILKEINFNELFAEKI